MLMPKSSEKIIRQRNFIQLDYWNYSEIETKVTEV